MHVVHVHVRPEAGPAHKNPVQRHVLGSVRQEVGTFVVPREHLLGLVVAVAPAYVPRFLALFQPSPASAHVEGLLQGLEFGLVREELAVEFVIAAVEASEEGEAEGFDGGPVPRAVGDDSWPGGGQIGCFEFGGGDVFYFIYPGHAFAKVAFFRFPENF